MAVIVQCHGRALEGLQDPENHTKNKEVVNEGTAIQKKLIEWADTQDRYE